MTEIFWYFIILICLTRTLQSNFELASRRMDDRAFGEISFDRFERYDTVKCILFYLLTYFYKVPLTSQPHIVLPRLIHHRFSITLPSNLSRVMSSGTSTLIIFKLSFWFKAPTTWSNLSKLHKFIKLVIRFVGVSFASKYIIGPNIFLTFLFSLTKILLFLKE